MSTVIKVTESFILPASATKDQLAAVILEASQCQFQLHYKGRQENVLQVSLVRRVDGAFEMEEDETETQTPDKAEEEEARDEHEPAVEEPEETQQRGPKPPDYPPPIGRKRDSQSSWEGWQQAEWQQAEWQQAVWQQAETHQGCQQRGGTACHVCGLVRAEHPAKRFCDVKAQRVRR